MENELMGTNKLYESLLKDENAPKIGSRIDRLFERDEFPGHAYRVNIDRNRPPGQNNPFSL